MLKATQKVGWAAASSGRHRSSAATIRRGHGYRSGNLTLLVALLLLGSLHPVSIARASEGDAGVAEATDVVDAVNDARRANGLVELEWMGVTRTVFESHDALRRGAALREEPYRWPRMTPETVAVVVTNLQGAVGSSSDVADVVAGWLASPAAAAALLHPEAMFASATSTVHDGELLVTLEVERTWDTSRSDEPLVVDGPMVGWDQRSWEYTVEYWRWWEGRARPPGLAIPDPPVTADEVFDAINERRESLGLDALEPSGLDEMVERANVDLLETRVAHRIIGDLREEYGGRAQQVGEIQIVSDPLGVFSGAMAAAAWEGSPPHAAIMLSPGSVGLAVAVHQDPVTLELAYTAHIEAGGFATLDDPEPGLLGDDGDEAAEDVEFRDIAGTTHEVAIRAVAAAGIAGGFDDGTYRPGHAVTRGQMATFLTRALGLDPVDTGFDDAVENVHAGAIGAVADADIAGGFNDGTYRPSAAVTRGQMATFLTRALDLNPGDASFPDILGTTHEVAIGAVAAAEIAGGFGDGTYRPGDPVTRGQMATFLARGLELVRP